MFSLSALLGFPQFSERDVQARMQQFENARRSGTFLMPSAMDAAGQEALRRLLKGQTPGGQFDAPINQNPPQPNPNYTPTQGGAWGDAEQEQQKLVNAGVPTIR
jgi:hypothetical protein